jgi:hypothetical protein
MSPSSRTIPPELLQQLHNATEQLEASRGELEKSLDASEFRHEERVNAAEEQFRKAERELEEVNEKIRAAIRSSDTGGDDGGGGGSTPRTSPATPAS